MDHQRHLAGPWLALATLLLGCLISTQAIALSEFQKRAITKHLESPKVVENRELFDGTAFNPDADLQTVFAYVNDYIKTLDLAIKAWNRLPRSEMTKPDARPILQRLQKKLAWRKAMKAAFPGFRDAKRAEQGGSAPAPRTAAPRKAAPPKPKPPAGGTKMNDYEKRKMLTYLDGKNMRQDSAIFDGQRFVASVPFTKVKQYNTYYQSSLKSAKRNWDRIVSARSKATDEGKYIGKRLQQALAWGQAMAADYGRAQQDAQNQARRAQDQRRQVAAQAQAQRAAIAAECKRFYKEGVTPIRREDMTRFVLQAEHQNQSIGSVEHIKKHLRNAEAVLQVCKTMKLDLLRQRNCGAARNNPGYDPLKVCAAVTQAPKLVKGMVRNHVRRTAGSIGSSTVQSPEQFRSRNGWLTYEGPVTFKSHLSSGGNAIPPAARENLRKLMAAAGLNPDDAWGGQDARLVQLRKEVEKTAGSWPLPEKRGDNYSGDLARRGVKRWHKDADIKAAYLSRSTWKIHRNALGVILRRTLPGYVVFKLPGDPFCQLRSYTLTEQYSGAGTYQKAGGVRIGYVRFQKCP